MAEDVHNVAHERLLRRSEAARYLIDTWRISCSVATLAKLAVAGSGPEFRKAGRTPLYPQDGLDTVRPIKDEPPCALNFRIGYEQIGSREGGGCVKDARTEKREAGHRGIGEPSSKR